MTEGVTAILLLIGGGCLLAALACRYYFPFRLPKPANRLRVFMYHATDERDGLWGIPKRLNMTPSRLEAQLRYLVRRGSTFLFASEVGTCETQRPVCLTFDDGYLSNHKVLFPLLKRYQAKATIFLSRETVFPQAPLLGEAEICEMLQSGLVEFGAHTISHAHLPELPDKQAEAEILQSKHRVENLTGKPCTTFAYPFGQFTSRDIDILKRNGFVRAFTCERGIPDANTLARDPYRIPRIYVNGNILPFEFHLLCTRAKFKL